MQPTAKNMVRSGESHSMFAKAVRTAGPFNCVHLNTEMAYFETGKYTTFMRDSDCEMPLFRIALKSHQARANVCPKGKPAAASSSKDLEKYG